MAAPNLIKTDIVEALNDRLGDDTRTYVKSRHLADRLDYSARDIGKALEALSQLGPIQSYDGLTVEKWSDGYTGTGYTWAVKRERDHDD